MMRSLIILCSFASAYAITVGYNYENQKNSFHNQQNSFQTNSVTNVDHQQQQQQHINTFSPATPDFLREALQNIKVSQGVNVASATSYIPPANNPISQPLPQVTLHHQVGGFQPSFSIQQQATYNQYASQQQQQYQQNAYAQQPALVTKDIYVHVAPEDREEQYQRPVLAQPPPPPPPRKHYRIVFIKAPTHKAQTAAVRVNQAPTEEKTIIYVLTRKPDPIDLEAAYQAAPPKLPSKPEVYFIKYRTQEEAHHAQRTIQAQYDQLGGTTQISDEGVAPVTSVIGSLRQQQGGVAQNVGVSSSSSGSSNSNVNLGTISGADSKYLPPIARI